jgi:hypothetical protein
MGAKAAPEVLYRLGQFGLIVLDRQHIVGAAFLNRLRNGDLCAPAPLQTLIFAIYYK